MTAPLRLGSLCSGYEGLGMAIAAVLDVDLTWVADPDPGATAILTHHHPDVPNLGDITALDWATVPPIDVLAAGFPCQDISYAGRGAGITKGTRSGLWHTIADAIPVLRPGLVILENVRAIVSRRPGLDVVLGDLARLGFDAEWTCVRASDVGAPHKRERWFCIAWPADTQGPRLQGARLRRRPSGSGRAAAHPDRVGDDRTAAQHRPDRRPFTAAGTAPHPTRDGRNQGRPEPARLVRRPDASLGRDAAAYADRGGQRPHQHDLRPGQPDVEWGAYGPAIDRWARILGRAAPAPTEPGREGRPRLNPLFVEWLMGLPLGHVTAVPGLTRNQQLKALGNGVVPQQGAAALALLLDRIQEGAAA